MPSQQANSPPREWSQVRGRQREGEERRNGRGTPQVCPIERGQGALRERVPHACRPSKAPYDWAHSRSQRGEEAHEGRGEKESRGTHRTLRRPFAWCGIRTHHLTACLQAERNPFDFPSSMPPLSEAEAKRPPGVYEGGRVIVCNADSSSSDAEAD